MNKKEFEIYLINQAPTLHESFYQKAYQFQSDKNKRRQSNKQWTDKKVSNATNDMWKQFIDNVYNSVLSHIKKESRKSQIAWIEKIEEFNLIESLEETVSDLDFNAE